MGVICIRCWVSRHQRACEMSLATHTTKSPIPDGLSRSMAAARQTVFTSCGPQWLGARLTSCREWSACLSSALSLEFLRLRPPKNAWAASLVHHHCCRHHHHTTTTTSDLAGAYLLPHFVHPAVIAPYTRPSPHSPSLPHKPSFSPRSRKNQASAEPPPPPTLHHHLLLLLLLLQHPP
jgi:hypothetical protein